MSVARAARMPALRVESVSPLSRRASCFFRLLACVRYMIATTTTAMTDSAPPAITYTSFRRSESFARKAALSNAGPAVAAFFRGAPGRRLTSIIQSETAIRCRSDDDIRGVSLDAKRQPDRQHHEWSDFISDERFKSAVTYLEVRQRVRQRDVEPQTIAEPFVQARHTGAAARGEDLAQLGSAGGLLEKRHRAVDAGRDLFPARFHDRVDARISIETLEYLPRVFIAHALVADEILAQPARADGNVARQNRDPFLEQIDVGHVVPDVQHADDTGHRVRMVQFESVVERERLDVHHRSHDAGVCQHPHLRFDQLTLRRDQQHAHLRRVAGRIEGLVIELHGLDVERHVVLGLPTE